MATLTEPATNAPPTNAHLAASANVFFRPSKSESQPCASAPMASPKLKTPLTPPRTLCSCQVRYRGKVAELTLRYRYSPLYRFR
jgi:hypothetical protein